MSESTRREALKLTAAAGAAALGTAFLQSSPALAQRSGGEITFESINREMERPAPKSVKLSANKADAAREALGSEFCDIYKKVRPILVAIRDSVLTPPSWKAWIGLFIEFVDKICPQQ